MRTYGRIETSFWQNPKVRALSCDESRYLLLYLYTCPHGNSLGCFVLPDGYIMADLNWPYETLALRFSELVAKGFIEGDAESFLVRIVGWFGHNKIENRNVAQGAVKIIAALPSGAILDSLLADLVALENKFLTPLLIQAGRIPDAIETPSDSPEPEPEPEPKPDPEPVEAAATAAARPRAPTGPRISSTGARPPQDWAPSPDDIAFAAAAGLAEGAIQGEAAKFRDYWIAVPGARGRKLDWPATWKNWIRRMAEAPLAGRRTDPPNLGAARDTLAGWAADADAREAARADH